MRKRNRVVVSLIVALSLSGASLLHGRAKSGTVVTKTGIIRGITPWQEPFDKYGVQIAIVSPTSTLRLQLEQSPQWQQVIHRQPTIWLPESS